MSTVTIAAIPSNTFLESPNTDGNKTLSVEILHPGLSNSILKDVHAYEHERQHAKKAVEVARLKERKDNSSFYKARPPAPRNVRSRRSGRKARWSWVKGESVADDPDRHESPTQPISPLLTHKEPYMEVNLADLLKPSKARRVRGSADFEVVPRVRSVIALDEFPPTGHDLELDEPWEHVYEEEHATSDRGINPSYAQVVAVS